MRGLGDGASLPVRRSGAQPQLFWPLRCCARSPRTGAWEVEGIPEPLRDHYACRAAQVDAIADAGREEKLRVLAETRHAKHDTGVIDLRVTWRRRAEDLGYDVDAMVAAAAPARPAPTGHSPRLGPTASRTPSLELIAVEVLYPQHGLTVFGEEFSKAQLLARVADACPLGLEAAELSWKAWRSGWSRSRGTSRCCRRADDRLSLQVEELGLS